jgi:WD40 repeat protein/mono/diheme cytochrome c family protein
MQNLKTIISVIAIGFLLGTMTLAQENASYQAVDAIIQEKCIACHNHTTRKGELNLENFTALINGGKRGVPVIPGQASESLLVKYIEGTMQPRMPLGDQLSAAEIKIIKAWIDAGAKEEMGNAEDGKDKTKSETPSPKTNLPEVKLTVPVKAAISSLAISPNGALLALGSYQAIELLTAEGKAVSKLTGSTNQVRALAFSPDGKLLASAGGSPAQFGEVKIYNVADGKEVAAIRGHRDNIFSVAFSPDGKLLATCSYDKMVKLWDVASGKELKNLKDHTDAVFAVAFCPDGKRLASAAADRTVKIWDVATGERLYTLSDALDTVNTIAFHPSGKYLAGAGADRIIHIWELGDKDGKRVRSLISHEDAINAIAYSPDGTMIVSTGADKAVKLWEAATLNEIKVLEAQPDWVLALVFHPDWKRLVVGRYDGSVVSYELLSGKGVVIK